MAAEEWYVFIQMAHIHFIKGIYIQAHHRSKQEIWKQDGSTQERELQPWTLNGLHFRCCCSKPCRGKPVNNRLRAELQS